jgi:hypothetical protein
MTDDDFTFELTRRKALAAIGTVGAASAGAGLGTSAYSGHHRAWARCNALPAIDRSLAVVPTYNYLSQPDWRATGGSIPRRAVATSTEWKTGVAGSRTTACRENHE